VRPSREGRDPEHVVVFENAIDFAMSPWWNLDELGKTSP